MSGFTRRSDIGKLSRSTFQPKVRKLVMEAAKAGLRFKITRNGVMFYGDNGEAITIHRTESDSRAEKNTIARFKRIGFDPEGKQ